MKSIVACILFCTPILAGSFSLIQSGSGGAGDACQPNTPQSAAEGFSYSGSGTAPLSLSGSAVGYNNGSGCQNSPVEGTTGAGGFTTPGSISATSYATMQTYLVSSASQGYAEFDDTITALSGGTYMVTIESTNDETASLVCPVIDGDGNATTSTQTHFVLTNQNGFGGIIGEANWTNSDCSPVASMTTYGSPTIVNPGTVEFLDTLPAGIFFTLHTAAQANTSLEGGLGEYPASSTGEADMIVTVEGLNGATYTTASGASLSSAPEPASWLLAACVLGLFSGKRWLGVRSSRAHRLHAADQ